MYPSKVLSTRQRNRRVEVFIKWHGLPNVHHSWFPNLHLGDKVIVDEGVNNMVPIKVNEKRKR
ncbi:unnamed protein product [Spirodela intermedia]|uniref:Chromo domain-containing protein n=1 Tax=Spirodela intermedia TaxID=51605 RepID=A0A7I8KKW3_SPIIN|nr:unnamed protein product [Spirodela intermedia]